MVGGGQRRGQPRRCARSAISAGSSGRSSWRWRRRWWWRPCGAAIRRRRAARSHQGSLIAAAV